LDDEAGTLTDITGASAKATISSSANSASVRVFADDDPITKVCGKDTTIGLECFYSTAADEAVDLLKHWWFNYFGTARSIEIYVPDSTVGSDKFYGEVQVTSLELPLEAGNAEPIRVSVELVTDGVFALMTVAS